MLTLPPLFISFGPELVWALIAYGLVWLLIIAVQVTTAFMTVRCLMRGQIGRGVIWALALFALTTAEPMYRWVDNYRAEQAMNRAHILRDVPDFTGKDVLYVPSRSLDDVSLSCVDLVQLSGAKTVYLAEPWYETVSSRLPDPLAEPGDKVDLRQYIKGTAMIETRDYGDICKLEPSTPPQSLDYILIENLYGDLAPVFRPHLEAQDVTDPATHLRFLIAPVPDVTGFQLSSETTDLALFSTWRKQGAWPYSPLRQNTLRRVPRDTAAFLRPIRQSVCREAPDAIDTTCWPFH